MQIVSDSSTLYSTLEGKQKGIEILPLHVVVDGKSYLDLDELSSATLLKWIEEEKIPTSSQPSIGQKIDLYEAIDDTILDITMAQGLSGTYDSACLAKNSIEDGEKITVWNSKTLCGPHRGLVDLANRLNKEGKSLASIIEILDQCRASEHSFLIPRDFSFLARGGRVKNLEAKLGGILKLVPTTKKSEDGTCLTTFSITRTFKKSIAQIIAYFKEHGVDSSYTFYIAHADNRMDAEKAESMLKEAFPGAKIEILPLSPVFIAQGGPQCVSIQTIRLQ